MIKNVKMEKLDLTLSTYVQYVEDFKFRVNVAGRPHRIPDKEIAKKLVNGLKPRLFREETYSRSFENLDDVVREAREELPTKEFTKEKKGYSQSFTEFEDEERS